MLKDARATFADGQTLASAISDLGDDDYNTGGTLDLGPGEDWGIVFQVGTAITIATGVTCEMQILEDSATGLGSPTVIASSGAIAKALLIAGHQVFVPFPKGVQTEQFIGVRWITNAGTFSTGVVSAFVANRAQFNKTYVQ